MSRIWPWRAEKTDWTFIAQLLQNFNAALRPGGTICFEFGYGQETGVGELLEAAGFTDVMFRKDLTGRDPCGRGKKAGMRLVKYFQTNV